MRVLVSCLQSRNRHPIPAYHFWRSYFVRGLEEADHEVLEVPDVDWAEGLIHPRGAALDLWRDRIWERVRSFLGAQQQRKPDLFLSYLYPKQVDVGAIQEIQASGIPCVNFFCDNVREFRTVPAEYHPFALHWVPEFEALAMYRASGLAHVHAPMPCWIPVELRDTPQAETEPPTFIGSADPLRRDLLGHAIQSGADFIVRGRGWADAPDELTAGPQESRSASRFFADQFASVRAHGPGILARKLAGRLSPAHAPSMPSANIGAPVSGDEYFRLTREALVAIGVNRVPTARTSNRRSLRYSRLRDIEAPMLGACYLTEWTEGLGEIYALGEEVETYRTAEELGIKLAELKKYPELRLRMRRRGQLRALHEHSVTRSIGRITKRLGLSPGFSG
jgi:hypothetical protein